MKKKPSSAHSLLPLFERSIGKPTARVTLSRVFALKLAHRGKLITSMKRTTGSLELWTVKQPYVYCTLPGLSTRAFRNRIRSQVSKKHVRPAPVWLPAFTQRRMSVQYVLGVVLDFVGSRARWTVSIGLSETRIQRRHLERQGPGVLLTHGVVQWTVHNLKKALKSRYSNYLIGK